VKWNGTADLRSRFPPLLLLTKPMQMRRPQISPRRSASVPPLDVFTTVARCLLPHGSYVLAPFPFWSVFFFDLALRRLSISFLTSALFADFFRFKCPFFAGIPGFEAAPSNAIASTASCVFRTFSQFRGIARSFFLFCPGNSLFCFSLLSNPSRLIPSFLCRFPLGGGLSVAPFACPYTFSS